MDFDTKQIDIAIEHIKAGNISGLHTNMAITALERMKAKKVITWADGTEHCPNCDYDNSCIGYGFCIDCGQKLDWSE